MAYKFSRCPQNKLLSEEFSFVKVEDKYCFSLLLETWTKNHNLLNYYL